MSTLVIDYGSGNLRSAARALERAAAEAGCGGPIVVSSDADAVARADRIVLPGVGAFADCRRGLEAVPGLVEALRAAVLDAGRPFLGICVGMQLLATTGREHGSHPGLGWIEGEVVPVTGTGRDGRTLKIPHMGWNDLQVDRPDHALLTGIASGDHAYFVHSYQFMPADPADRLAVVDYGSPVTAAVARDNLVGTQFHPEKSQATGLRLLRNFLRWHP